jgi:hypothetical protein
VYGDHGVKAFDTSSGSMQGNYYDNMVVTAVASGVMPGSGLSMFAACVRKSLVIHDTSDGAGGSQIHAWDEDSPTLGVSIDGTGELVCYGTQRKTVVRKLTCGTILRTFDFMTTVRSTFSHADSSTIVVSGTGQGRYLQFFGRRIKVASVSTGQELPWSPLLHAAFSTRHIMGPTVGCSMDCSQTGPGEGVLIHAAEKSEVLQFDMEKFSRSVDDGALTGDLLIALAIRRPDAVARTASDHPDCVNIQNKSAGDTVLHYLARETGKNEEVKAWLEKAAFTPIANDAGKTALYEAVSKYNAPLCLELVNALSKTLSASSARLLTSDIKHLAATMPRLLLPCLQAADNAVFQTLRSFRAVISRTEVRGMNKLHSDANIRTDSVEKDTNLRPAMKGDAVGVADQIAALRSLPGSQYEYEYDIGSPVVENLWEDLEGTGEVEGDGVRVFCRVVAMEGFIGDPAISSFQGSSS